MSIASEIENLVGDLRNKLGNLTTEAEEHLAAFLGLAKDQEAAAEAKLETEIKHLESLGYSVTKSPEAVVGTASAP
ncbi:MAG TPA: hypothetical protein VF483_02505 [Gemmatimonadaceae bacterium]